MNKNYFSVSIATILILSFPSFAKISGPVTSTLASGPTLVFSNDLGFTDNIANDGDGGSVTISDFDIQVYPINSSGNKLSTDPVQYHDGTDPNWSGYPAIITYGDVNPMYGWTIKSGDGSSFSLDSLSFLDWGNFNGATFAITAFENGNNKGTITFKGNVTSKMVSLKQSGLLTTAFKNVDEVRIYQFDGKDSYIALNNIKVSAAVVTNVNNEQHTEQILLFPNPSEGLFTVYLNNATKVTITNTLGNVVFEKELSAGESNIDLSNEMNGVYLINIQDSNKNRMVKFIKK